MTNLDIEIAKLEQEIFTTVYEWGRVGIVVDEYAPTFKNLMRKYRKLIKAR